MKNEMGARKRLNIPQKRRRAIRNLLLAAAALVLTWILAGMPAFSKEQAFDRALRQNLLPDTDAEVIFGRDGRWAVLGEKDGRMIQAAVTNSGFFWYTTGMTAVTEATDGVYIVPLVTYGEFSDPAEMAVKAPGVRAELTLELDGRSYPLIADEKQGDWFRFRFDRELEKGTGSRYDVFLETDQFFYIDGINTGADIVGGTFRFTSYDESGAVAAQAERGF